MSHTNTEGEKERGREMGERETEKFSTLKLFLYSILAKTEASWNDSSSLLDKSFKRYNNL